MENTKKLTGKDLINVGIYTAMTLVIFFVVGLLTALPVVYPFLFIIWPIVCGIPMMLYYTKIQKFGMLTITGIIGGISFVLYGMISAIGVRNVVENRVDFTNSRNLIIAAVILVSALGFNSVGGLTFAVAGVSINLSGLAIAAIVGILLNAILPGNDYEFDSADGADAPSSGNLQV